MDRRKAAVLLLLALSLSACKTLAPAALRYVVTATPLKLLGANQGASTALRSSSGDPLKEGQTRRFTTPVSLLPVDLFFDPKVGPPLPVVRTNLAGDNTQAARRMRRGVCQVCGPQGKPVHRRVVEARQIVRSADLLCKDAL